MLGNKKLTPVVTEYFIRGRKLNISLVFITQSYFAVPKDIRRNSTLLSDNPLSFIIIGLAVKSMFLLKKLVRLL